MRKSNLDRIRTGIAIGRIGNVEAHLDARHVRIVVLMKAESDLVLGRGAVGHVVERNVKGRLRVDSKF